jgi:DNA invertase Pin-like site-specific DNA recombinase
LRVAIYSRVSTTQQNDDAQYEELAALCARCGWEITQVYREKVSGTKSADARPELKKLLTAARQRRFEKVVVWSADRLGRSMRHLVSVLGELNDCGVHVFSYKQGIDTSTPMGSMLWQFLGIFAEFEHGIRRERQALGIAKAKARGVRFGRPPVSLQKRRQIALLRSQGQGINKIARGLNVGTGTVYRVLSELHAEVSRIQ